MIIMKRRKIILIFIAITITAAAAAVIFNRLSVLAPAYKTVMSRDGKTCITEEGRRVTVSKGGNIIWQLPKEVLAQDFLFEDIDHDGQEELMILCWKRGRFGKRRPFWVKYDEIGWSQHIFIYEIEGSKVKPKWMASNIGMKAASWKFEGGKLIITDTDNVTTEWVWISWGLEKL